MAFGMQLSAWDGRPTRHVPLQPWVSDHHGAWYRWAAGAPSRAADGAELRPSRDSVVLVPARGEWTARWGGDGGVEVHAKVTTAIATTGHGISAVDLGLDVVRFTDGRVAVIDQDAFDRWCAAHAHPDDVVERALATARALYGALRRGDEPFGTAGARRLAHARPGGLAIVG